MYGSVEAVKDNLPKIAEYIKPDEEAVGDLDIPISNVEQYLKEFTAQMDAALSHIYKVPLGQPPPIVNKVVSDLASYKLSRRFYTFVNNDKNYSLMALRKDAKEILADLAAGKYELPGVEKKGGDSLDLSGIEQGETIFDMEEASTWQDKL